MVAIRKAVATEDAEELLCAVSEKARPTHVSVVRGSFLSHLDDDELDELRGFWRRMLPESCLR
jgi:hypothetical protein